MPGGAKMAQAWAKISVVQLTNLWSIILNDILKNTIFLIFELI